MSEDGEPLLSVAEAIVDGLVSCGVTAVFVPGSRAVPAFQRAFHRFQQDGMPDVRKMEMPDEAACSFAACAYARVANTPALVIGDGVGLVRASIGLLEAREAALPLLFLAVTPSDKTAAFAAHLTPVCKSVFVSSTPQEAVQLMGRAYLEASDQQPGPVALVVPEDQLEVPSPPLATPVTGGRTAHAAPAEDMIKAGLVLGGATRPLLIVGELVRIEAAVEAAIALAEKSGAAVLTDAGQNDHFPNSHPAYIGSLDTPMAEPVRTAFEEADVIYAMGTRLSPHSVGLEVDLTSEGTRAWIHSYPDQGVLRAAASDMQLHGDPGETARAMAACLEPNASADLIMWRERLHRSYLEESDRRSLIRPAFEQLVEELKLQTDDEIVVVAESDRPLDAVNRHFWMDRLGSLVCSASAVDGFAVPATLGAAGAAPKRQIVAFVGDRACLVSASSLASLAQHKAKVVLVVCDGTYTTAGLGSQTPGLSEGVPITNKTKGTNFAALAAAHGIANWTVSEPEGFPFALHGALKTRGPALVHVLIDLENHQRRTEPLPPLG